MRLFFRLSSSVAVIFAAVAFTAAADAPWKEIPRSLPPQGTALTAEARQRLETELAAYRVRQAAVRKQHDDVVDAEVFAKAVDWALRFDEFYNQKKDPASATEALKTANSRLDSIAKGQQPWRTQRGPVACGYRSAIDGSVQPFGVVVPEKLDLKTPAPLFVWLHGRGETNTDLNFLQGRAHNVGEIKTDKAIVLHVFGRHCVGYKSAGEIDVLEAIAAVQQRYQIDPDGIVLMGFSMGGAGAWHLGAHYADHFAGVHAGAGFVDVARYQNLSKDKYPPSYEQVLWGDYDVPDYVRNLFNVPVLAYSGEVDKQKASADIMDEAFKAEGQKLPRLIGPMMGHKYDPESLKKVIAWAEEHGAKGRDKNANDVHLQTRTLRYATMKWITALRLDQHWQDSRIDASLGDSGTLTIMTKNVAALEFSPPKLLRKLVIDGQTLDEPQTRASNPRRLEKRDGAWGPYQPAAATEFKSPGLQGPIDDAFLAPFLVVLPSGKSKHPEVQRWVEFESAHLLKRWQTLFRGEARVKLDHDVTADDMQAYNLILWGDPTSNSLIAKFVGKLPITWTDSELSLGSHKLDAAVHVPLLIYPNRLVPAGASRPRYVVLNSGPTFREAHDKTNSLQNPKLPDWALVDVRTPPDAEKPGKIVAADFFDERWQVTAAK